MIKIILILIAVLNGGWMIFDGVHVLLKGKYFAFNIFLGIIYENGD